MFDIARSGEDHPTLGLVPTKSVGTFHDGETRSIGHQETERIFQINPTRVQFALVDQFCDESPQSISIRERSAHREHDRGGYAVLGSARQHIPLRTLIQKVESHQEVVPTTV